MLARFLSILSIATVALLWSASSASAQVAKVEKTPPTYMVVDVEDNLQIIKSEDFEAAQKQIEESYREALDAWKDLKKKNPKLEQKQPVKAKLTVVARNLADVDAARDALQRAQEKKVVAKQPKQPKKQKEGRER